MNFQDSHWETALESPNSPTYGLLVNEEVRFVNPFTNYVVQEKETESPLGVNVINQFTAEADQVLTRLSSDEQICSQLKTREWSRIKYKLALCLVTLGQLLFRNGSLGGGKETLWCKRAVSGYVAWLYVNLSGLSTQYQYHLHHSLFVASKEELSPSCVLWRWHSHMPVDRVCLGKH